jgi:hypothetical protein
MPEAVVATKSTAQGLSPPPTKSKCLELFLSRYVRMRMAAALLARFKAALCWRLQFASEPARDPRRFHRVSKLDRALNVFTSRAFERSNVRAKGSGWDVCSTGLTCHKGPRGWRMIMMLA